MGEKTPLDEGYYPTIRFRKRPVVIEAVQYDGKGNLHRRYRGGVPEWLWEAFEQGVMVTTNGADPLYVNTMEGRMEVRPGDWIIRGVNGELYPCHPDIFEKTYEAVEA